MQSPCVFAAVHLLGHQGMRWAKGVTACWNRRLSFSSEWNIWQLGVQITSRGSVRAVFLLDGCQVVFSSAAVLTLTKQKQETNMQGLKLKLSESSIEFHKGGPP